jgi:ribosomal-protein-alanine N-acetyltransferase
MTTLPHIPPRTRLTVLTPGGPADGGFLSAQSRPPVPWEPRREESFYTLAHWQTRLRDGYGHYFEGSAVQLVALDPGGSGCSPPAISRTL